MRQQDREKDSLLGMATKTINFEKIVLMELEKKAKQGKTSVSKIVNLMCRRIAMNDKAFAQAMMKHHHMKFQEYKYMFDTQEVMQDPVLKEIQMQTMGKLIE